MNYVGDFSYDGLSKRGKVLEDQRITRSVLNNTPIAKQMVIDSKGTLTKEEIFDAALKAHPIEDTEAER